MIVFLRTDSSLSIGSGHVIRCLNIAKALKKAGAQCYFVSKNHRGNILSKISEEDFPIEVIYVSEETDFYIKDEKSWLNGSQSEDAESFINSVVKICEAPDIIVVDHYSLDIEWEKHVKTRFPETNLVAIDDLCNRDHFSDLLIDQTYQRSAKEYRALNINNGKILTGTRYALLNPIFSKLRNKSIALKENVVVPSKLMLTMGGVDAHNVAGKVLEYIEHEDFDHIEKITVILGTTCPHSAATIEFAKKSKYCIDVLSNVSNMAELMLEHDFAIGALGGTTWERCAMGLPAVNIAIANNQSTIANNLGNAGAIVLDADSLSSSNIRNALDGLITHYHQQRMLASDICDGQGLIRDIQEMILISAKDGQNVTLRQANFSDIDFVYQLQCEPQTRQFARNTCIPSYENHVKWMQGKLNSENALFYIIEHHDACGVLRLDPIEHTYAKYEISIFLTSTCLGKGVASAAIRRALMLHSEDAILATVLPENHASHQLFDRLGFQKISPNEYINEIK